MSSFVAGLQRTPIYFAGGLALCATLMLTVGCGGEEDSSDGTASSASGPNGTVPGSPGTPILPVVGSSDEMPWFSSFTTSMDGLLSLAADPVNGFGGDFGGLTGADQICATLARRANPTDAKVWVAFLSTAGYDGGAQVDAIDRVGSGPWYDFNQRLFAQDVAGLLADNGRPNGDAQLSEMFTDEYGEPIRPNDSVDNHDMLTGSGSDGRLYNDEVGTCHDWTDSTIQAEGGGMMFGGTMGDGQGIPVGHAWPRTANNGRGWIQEHTVNGCEPGISIELGAGAPSGDYTVGAGGGYGGFYCFALGALAP